MKKNAFTLAEVLITLTIIGVIATLTLPALITNTQEQQAKTALKKGIGTLTEIAQMNSAVDGFDYASMQTDTWGKTDPINRSMFAMMANRASIDFQKSSNTATDIRKIFPETNDAHFQTPDRLIVFRDGTALLYKASDAATAVSGSKAALMLPDGLPKGFTAIFDTNGFKGPNLVSNCLGAVAGGKDADKRLDATAAEVTSGTTITTEDEAAKCTNDKRIIKDQFKVQLRGGYAQPYGAASTWAFNN